MFSIIIPLYNKAPYVLNSIDSILNQTFQKFELIIVDDGSTDDGLLKIKNKSNDLKIINPELANKIRIIEQENQGVSIARNNGISHAKFENIVFLDADDWWDLRFLSLMQELMLEFPDAGIFGASYYKVKNGINFKADVGVDKNFVKGYIDYFKVYAKTLWMPLCTGSIVIRRTVLNAIGGFTPQLKLGEDFDLWVRIALKYKVAFLNMPLFYYNQDVSNVNRGVIADKIYSKEEHVIFNLDYLSNEEKEIRQLKLLLDKLRVYQLIRYRLASAYPTEVQSIISKVDFSELGLKYRFYYFCPLFILTKYFSLLKYGSAFKKILIKLINKNIYLINK